MTMDLDPPTETAPPSRGYSIAHQRVDLEIDFSRKLRGSTDITLYPESRDLKLFRVNARQCRILKLSVNGIPVSSWIHNDPYDCLTLSGQSTIEQHSRLAQRIQKAVQIPPEEDLIVSIPAGIVIEEVNLTEVHTQSLGTVKIQKSEGDLADPAESTQALADTSVAKYTPLAVHIEWHSKGIRDGVHIVTHKPGTGRWPHAYSRSKNGPGCASSTFPCLDSLNDRCTWEISIKCPRTIGDALRQSSSDDPRGGQDNTKSNEENREMLVLCSGDVTDDIIDKSDNSKRTVSFSCLQQLSAQQIGFAVGPFQHVNLSDLRDAQEDDDLGQNSVEMNGYCLPGRAEEVENTCLPTPRAMDFFTRKYCACPISTYSMCFVEDLSENTTVFSGITLCSTRLLYPEDVLDPAEDVTRTLVQAVASQWMGISIIPEKPHDTWAVMGISHFMTENFMKDLCGNNEYRYRMKQQSDLVCELDRDRPSLYDMGDLLNVDPSETRFMAIKAPVVLFILDRRIAKVVGSSKMPAIITKILSRSRLGELADNCLSTEIFQKTCERFYHAKIDQFIKNWVRGSGVPRFRAVQRFNKKKLVIEMMIDQLQGSAASERDLEVDSFMRDVREEFSDVYAAEPQNVFTGPMTIRIHEADGTPYEHIVDINSARVSIEVPYNTKYKRLKRTIRQRTKNAAAAADGADGENDALLYCLGDVLQSEEEVAEWKLTDWTKEDEERMSLESYEWIRMDADFEWISRIQLQMPGYMFVSQLQQDRDIVAQLESIHHMNSYAGANELVSSILVRTMMDRRYFHGIRSLAARSLVKHASKEKGYRGLFHLKKAFEQLFCLREHDSRMTRPNDFSDKPSYYLQREIIEAISKVRDESGAALREVKEFLLDKLKFNDNSTNDFSDSFFVAMLLKATCTAIAAKAPLRDADTMELEEAEEIGLSARLEQECLSEVDRHRRMDEWTSSYQNLYTRTALDCQSLLASTGIGKVGPIHFLQYTRPGNYDVLRLTAFDNLIKANLFDNSVVLKYVLHCMATEASPYVRRNLYDSFGKALAIRAIGLDAKPVPASDGLIIEDAAAEEDRKRLLQRRQTLEGALGALSEELAENETLQKSLWAAVSSSYIGLDDLQSLLDFCKMIFEPVDELKLTLRYPRYWRVRYLGKGKLIFSETRKVRTTPIPKYQPPVRIEEPRHVPLKLKMKNMSQSVGTAPTPTPPPPPPSEEPSQPVVNKLKLKLKFKPGGI